MTGHVRQKSILCSPSGADEIKASSNGFTITELIVVIVIIGLLSALAVPSFLRTNAEAVLEGEAQRMLLDFRLAKQAANKTGLRHFIRVIPPRNIEVWRSKTTTDLAFDMTKDTLVFRDVLDPRVQMGSLGMSPRPTMAPDNHVNALPSTLDASSGLGPFNPSQSIEHCWDGAPYPTDTAVSPPGWKTKINGNYVIDVCGGAIADMVKGIMYLSTPRSTNRYYALTYNTHSIQVRLWSWNPNVAGQWELK